MDSAENMNLFHECNIDAPVYIRGARNAIRKRKRAAVFRAECRCFCCAKRARGAAGTQQYCTVYLKNVSENLLFRSFIRKGSSGTVTSVYRVAECTGALREYGYLFLIIFGFWLNSGRKFALYAEEHATTKDQHRKKEHDDKKGKAT